MVLIERLEEIKRLWYELELPLRQDIAYVYLDREQRIIKNIDERLELLLANRDFKRFLKKLREEHKFKEISEIERIFSKKYRIENAEFWHEEAQEAIIKLFRDILPDIKSFETYKKERHEMLRFKNEIPAQLQQVPKARAPSLPRIAIVGAGFSGLAAAYFLLKSGVQGKDIVIFEKDRVGSGSSGRSGGFLTASVEVDFIHHFYEYLAEHFPELRGIRFQKMWSGVIASAPDTYPLTGRIDNTNIYISLNNGIPFCFLSGKILADIMTKKTSEYADLFAPNRDMKKSTAQIFGALSKSKTKG